MRLAPSWLVPLAVVLSGCASKAQQVGGVPRSGAAPRVVSLSPSTTEIVASQLDVRLLVGRTQSDDYPPAVVSVPVVASVKPDFEKIKGVNPSFVVYDADLYGPDDIKRIQGMGAESFAFKAHTLDGFEKELYALSGKLGNETNVSGYVDRIEQEVSGAKGDHPANPPKVAVVLGDGGYLAGTESFLADVVKTCGGVPVGPASDKFAAMPPEALVAAAPDLIILATTKADAERDVAAIRANPRFASSPAVKSGRITPVVQDVLLRRGARVNNLVKDVHKAVALTASK